MKGRTAVLLVLALGGWLLIKPSLEKLQQQQHR